MMHVSLKEMNGGKESDFDILGCKIKFRANEFGDGKGPDKNPIDIVEYVQKEAALLRSKNSNLDDKQVAVLLALQFAREKLSLEKELNEGIIELQNNASKALELIEQVCPSTN